MRPMPCEVAYIATEIADQLMEESLYFARNQISHSDADRRDVMALATAHARVAAIAYAVLQLGLDINDRATEIAGAISEAGTDVGAGLAHALRARPCKRPK